MDELTDNYIFGKLSQAKVIQFEPQFSLKDLEGKTIHECKQIKYRKFREPRKIEKTSKISGSIFEEDFDDPHADYNYPPENIDVIIFSDDTFLATERRADGECSHLGCYYFNGEKTLYSDSLFGI